MSRSKVHVLPADRPTEWLCLKDVAAETRIALQTLYRLRCEGKGPASYKIAGQVRVRREDLNDWIESGVEAA